MIQETIYWHDATKTRPDDETTVLICTASGVVGEAFREDNRWHWTSADSVGEKVEHWADLPQGPSTRTARAQDVKLDLPHARDATPEELAPVLAKPDVGVLLSGGSANGSLAVVHANTHGDHSILVMQLRDEVWGYRITLPTREERKAEARRVINHIAKSTGARCDYLA
jgi:hypothetical protein